MDLTQLTIAAARSSIQERETTALALAEAHYAHIQKEDEQIGAFLTLCKERALEQADRIDRMAAEGKPLPPLAGVPVGIKDV
ncbi:MAG: amidase family protein, partial [Candidatus Sulfotelmatobacter sp.]